MSLSKNHPFSFCKLFQHAFIFILAAVCLTFPANLKAQAPAAAKKPVVFTEKDREAALKFLGETKAEFFHEISGLSEAQLNFKPDPKRWSVAEVAEHIIVAENLIYSIITDRVLKASAPEGKDNFRLRDQTVWLSVTNRSTKFNAPEQIQPNGRWKTKADILTNFETTREKTLSFVKTTGEDLRNHFGENPALGVIDGFQWVVFLNAHGYRHLEQIKEIKADAKFPKK